MKKWIITDNKGQQVKDTGVVITATADQAMAEAIYRWSIKEAGLTAEEIGPYPDEDDEEEEAFRKYYGK